MSDIDIFHKMIKDSVKIELNVNKKGIVVLREPQYPKSNVTIGGLPDRAIVIRTDAFKSPDTVFTGSMGECKRADFIIAAETDRHKTVICIEMKAGNKGENKKIIQQLKGAQCFIAYCREIGRVFYNKETFLDGCKYRFVSINHTGTSINKRKTQFETKAVVHDSPDKMMKINFPHRLYFNHLAGLKKK